MGMEGSVVYQDIFAKGRAEGLRRLMVRQGRLIFGEPSTKILKELDAIEDFGRLERMHDEIDRVRSWDDFLATT